MGTKGYKSTEFWLSLAAMILGAIMAAGIFPDDSGWAKLVGIAISGLSAMGYQRSRTEFKKAKVAADIRAMEVADAIDPS